MTVNALVNRLIAASATAARIFDGKPTMVISDGHVVQRALVHLGVRRSELDPRRPAAERGRRQRGRARCPGPGGQLVLTLKASEQGTTKADVADLQNRLGRIEELLAAR